MDPDARRMLGASLKYSYVGIFFGVSILVGYLIGSWLDGRLHTHPWMMLFWIGIGIAAGFRELIRLARQGIREQAAQDREPR